MGVYYCSSYDPVSYSVRNENRILKFMCWIMGHNVTRVMRDCVFAGAGNVRVPNVYIDAHNQCSLIQNSSTLCTEETNSIDLSRDTTKCRINNYTL